jgi:hypothetical protein
LAFGLKQTHCCLEDLMPVRKAFLDRVLDPSPALRVKYWPESDEMPRTVEVAHRLGSVPVGEGRDYLNSLRGHAALAEFVEFYENHDGLQFCRTFDSRFDEVRPLLEFKPAESLAGFTNRYNSGGNLAWTIDLNRSKSLYRGSASWLAFAEIGSGPACLTIFRDGEHAGKVFYVTPQPPFNILRPIAQGFDALLGRIAVDAAAFLRLVRATVSLRGPDGFNYGYVPVEYLPPGPARPTRPGRTKR